MAIVLALALVVAVPLGVAAAHRASGWMDRAINLGCFAGVSVPTFWLGLMLIVLFSVQLDLLPASGYVPIAEGIGPWFQSLILPSFSLAMLQVGLLARITRSAMLEVLRQDYIRTARAKGAPGPVVMFRHALRNSLIPVITVIGFQVGTLIGGATIVEVIFGLPGMGYTLVQGIFGRDYTVIEVAALFLASVFVIVNLLVDLLYGVIDPRIEQA